MEHASRALIGAFMSSAALICSAQAIAQPAPSEPTTPAADAEKKAQGQEQTVAGEKPEVAPADIIITAQRRSERLVNVPIAITAITGGDIERRGVTTLSDMQTLVPGLRIQDIGVGTERVQLRGVSQFLGLPTVGLYLDEFSVANFGPSGSADVTLLDLQRIEVLRGPQPTLYGEGSMGGTIRYVTADPDLTHVSGHAEGNINTVSHGKIGYLAEGILNVPLATDTVGLRIAGLQERQGGYIKGPMGNDLNPTTKTAIRGKLLVRPTPELTISAMVLHQDEHQPTKNFSNKDYVTAEAFDLPVNQKYTLGNLIASYDFGPVTLLSSTGLLHLDSRSVDDLGPFYNTFIFGAPVFTSALADTRGTFRKFSEEARVTSNAPGPFRYVVGGVYTHGKTHSNGDDETDPLIPGFAFVDLLDTSSEIWAAYANGSLDVTPKLQIDAGARYFHDRRTQHDNLTLVGLPIPPSITDQEGTFHSFNPRVAITYKTANGIIFANAAKGFRSGGFNQVIDPSTPPTFGPEKLWTYEVGTKQSLFHNRLLVELEGYYNDYKAIQAVVVQGAGTFAATTNGGNAHGPGVDVSFFAKATKDLSFSGSLGYNQVRYATTTVDRRKGEPLDLVPDWTYSLAADYQPRISARARLNAHLDYGFTDKAFIILHAGFLDQIAPTQSRAILNARLGVNFERYEAFVFGSNLTNTARIQNPAFGGYFEPIYTRPRTLGVGLKADF